MIITVPLQIVLKRKIKRDQIIHLSVNVWENLHHTVKTKVKNEITKIVTSQLPDVYDLGVKITVKCKLYSSHANLDLANFVTVIEKRATDCVVRNGFIANDTVKYINKHEYSYGGIDKDYPRLEIEYVRGE